MVTQRFLTSVSGSRQPSVLSRPPSISRVTVVPGAEHPSVNTEHQDEAGWSVLEVVGGGIVVEWLCAILKRAYNKKTTNKQKQLTCTLRSTMQQAAGDVTQAGVQRVCSR